MNDLIPQEENLDLTHEITITNLLSKIEPVVFPIIGTATRILVRVLPFDTIHLNCTLYYELQDEVGKVVYAANYTLTDNEFETWAANNEYLEDLVCNHLGIVKI